MLHIHNLGFTNSIDIETMLQKLGNPHLSITVDSVLNKLQDNINTIVAIKLKIDYEKIFIFNQICMINNIPKELFEFIYKLTHTHMAIWTDRKNIIINAYDTYIFSNKCLKLCNFKQKEIIKHGIKQLFMGKGFLVTLDKNDEVYHWATFDNLQKRISKNIKCISRQHNNFYLQPFSPTNTIYEINLDHYTTILDGEYNEITDDLSYEMVACGSNHIFYLMQDGTMDVEGDNDWGQLGLGYKADVCDEICKVYTKLRVAQVCCMINSTLIRTTSGEIYGCGLNAYRILNDSGSIVFYVFVKINIPGFIYTETIIDLQCTNTYAVVLTDQGHVYLWGDITKKGKLNVENIIKIVCCNDFIICIRYDERVRIFSIS